MSLEPIQMSQTEEERPSVQERLEDIVELLRKHEAAHPSPEEGDDTSRRELVEALVHTLHLAELQKLLDEMHPADIAYILESLPLEQRLIVWDLVKAERCLNNASEHYIKLGNEPAEAAVLRLLATIYEARHDRVSARRCLERVVSLDLRYKLSESQADSAHLARLTSSD